MQTYRLDEREVFVRSHRCCLARRLLVESCDRRDGVERNDNKGPVLDWTVPNRRVVDDEHGMRTRANRIAQCI